MPLRKMSPEFHRKLDEIAKKHRINKIELAKWMITESELIHEAKSDTSSATGIAQLTKGTATAIGVDYEKYKKSSPEQQLDALDKYLSHPMIKKYIGPQTTAEHFKVLGFGSAQGPWLNDDNHVVYPSGSKAEQANPRIKINTIGDQKNVFRQAAKQKESLFKEFENDYKEKVVMAKDNKPEILAEGYKTKEERDADFATLKTKAILYRNNLGVEKKKIEDKIASIKGKSAITAEENKILNALNEKRKELEGSISHAKILYGNLYDSELSKLSKKAVTELIDDYSSQSTKKLTIDKNGWLPANTHNDLKPKFLVGVTDEMRGITKPSSTNIQDKDSFVADFLKRNPSLTAEHAVMEWNDRNGIPNVNRFNITGNQNTGSGNREPNDNLYDNTSPFDSAAYDAWLSQRYPNGLRIGSVEEENAKIEYADSLLKGNNVNEYRNFVKGQQLEPVLRKRIGEKYYGQDLNDESVKRQIDRDVELALNPHLSKQINAKYNTPDKPVTPDTPSGTQNAPTDTKTGINFKDLLPETKFGLGISALQGVAGLGALINAKNDNGRPDYKTNPNLDMLTDESIRKAFGGGDDYASRIRAKNTYETNVEQAVNLSGGSRGMALSNINAAGDVLNTANLSIDNAFGQRKQQDMNTAAGLVGAQTQDKMNQFNDRYSQWIEEQNRKTAAAGIIKSAIGNVSDVLGHETLYGSEGAVQRYLKGSLERQKKLAGSTKEVKTQTVTNTPNVTGFHGPPDPTITPATQSGSMLPSINPRNIEEQFITPFNY